MKILGLHSQNAACSRYRIINPLIYLGERGHTVRWEAMDNRQQMCSSWFGCYDAVIIERFTDPGIIDLVDHIPTQWTPEGILKRPKIIYQMDDVPWRMRTGQPNKDKYTRNMIDGTKDTIRRSDAVIVSTPELGDEVRNLNPTVYVCPNAIDYKLRDWEPDAKRHPLLNGYVVIGWAGGDRLRGDFGVIGYALREVLQEHPEAILALAGSQDTIRDACRVMGIPQGRAVLLPPVPFDDYPSLLSQFDIGIAPLEDTPFNRCKSELKLLEYGALGIPFVASNVAPYLRFAKSFGSVCIADSVKDWKRLLSLLVSDGERREIIGTDARRFVKQNYDQEVTVSLWEDAINEVRRHEQRSTCNGNSNGRVHTLV